MQNQRNPAPSNREGGRLRGFVPLLGLLILSAFWLAGSAGEVILDDGFENSPPTIVSSPITVGYVGVPYSYDVDAIDANGDMLTYYFLESPGGMGIDPITGEIDWTPTMLGDYPVTVEVEDGKGGFDQQSWSINVQEAPMLPPEPVPSEIDPTVLEPFDDLYSFLYSGPDAIQVDVEEGAIEDYRVSVLRGMVTDRAGSPVSGASVSVLRDVPVGHTLTRVDGWYDIAVNGGGDVVIQVELDGYLTAHRTQRVPWHDIHVLDPIRLVPISPVATELTLSPTDLQVAMGEMETDADGSRRGVLLFQPGTQAELHFPNGTTQPISTMNVRITEFTVGDNGPGAMPAELPPTSGYTYAAEYSVDEVGAMDAESVHFDPPAVSYTDNFLGFPVGTAVPAGSYNRSEGFWEAGQDGIVVKIVAINGGLAELDLDGDDIADDPTGLGVTMEELEELAGMYSIGTELWRVDIAHFSPWDCNWPYRAPDDAEPPNPEHGPERGDSDPEDDCDESIFSTVECQSQVLRETIPIAGTDQSLHFSSKRAEGFQAGKTLEVVIPEAEIPDIATGVLISLEVAGTRQDQAFGPFGDIATSFVWDGLDAYGREVLGPKPYTMKVSFVYQGVYASGSSGGGGGGGGGGGSTFFSQPGVTIEGVSRASSDILLTRTFEGVLGGNPGAHSSIGSWSLTDHHQLSPDPVRLFLGDGTSRSDEDGIGTLVVRSWECTRDDCILGPEEGELMSQSHVANVGSAVPRLDGSLLLPVASHGMWTAWGRYGLLSEFRPESQPYGIMTPLPDGSMIYTHASNTEVRRLRGSSNESVEFGGGSLPIDDNMDFVGPAGQLEVPSGYRITGLAAAGDGSFYVSIRRNTNLRTSVWRRTPDGTAQRVAGIYGTDDPPDDGNGGPALDAVLFHSGGYRQGMVVDSQNNIWYSDKFAVRKIRNGIIDRAIGTGEGNCDPVIQEGPVLTTCLNSPQILALAPDDTLYIMHSPGPTTGRIFHTDYQNLRLIAGGDSPIPEPYDGANALQVRAGGQAQSLFYHPNGSLVIEGSDDYQIFLKPPFSNIAGVGVGDFVVPSKDGRLVYVFDSTGRHQSTIDTFLAEVIRTFAYDGAGRLISITDADSRVTTIQRDVDGVATAIVGPDGRVTQLTIIDGLLTSVTSPTDDSYTLGYGPAGELLSMTDPRGNTSSYSYDLLGRLEEATSRSGGVMSLARTSLGVGQFEVAVTTSGSDVRTYKVERVGADEIRSIVDPTGATTTIRHNADGLVEGTFPDGTVSSYMLKPDPRFGPIAAYVGEFMAQTPDGLTSTASLTSDAMLSDPADYSTMTEWSETQVRDGRTWVHHFDVATRTLTRTSPEGRVLTKVYDSAGRLLSADPGGGISPMVYTYDANGRLATVSQDSETLTLTYDADGDLVTATDDDGQNMTWTHDAAGRIESVTTPESRLIEFTLDENGNRTEVTMPESQVHSLAFDDSDRLDSYTAPGANPLLEIFDGIGRRTGVEYPDSTVRTDSYTDDLFVGSTLPEATLTVEYDPEFGGGPGTTGNISRLARDPDNRPEQALEFDLDGPVVTGLTMTGPAAASVTYTHGLPYEIASRTLNSEAPITFTYDNDGLITGIGPFTLAREAGTGLQDTISDGVLTLDIGVDSRANLVSRDLDHDVTAKYSLTLTRNDRAQIINRIETVDGVTTERNYEYDLDGRLIAVTDDLDDPVESFGYDDNSNRTSHSTTMGAAFATYNDQDQIITRDGVAYGYDDNGFLSTRGADTFDYAQDGGLRTATVGGTAVTYDHDFYGRRVARTDMAGTTTYVYGDLDHAFRITASIAPDSTVSEYLYDDAGVLFAFVRGGSWYYVGTDQVGSPRTVVEAASGNVIKTVSFDSFGSVLNDSNPGFVLPVGYAGGLPDPDTDLVRFGLRDYEPVSGRFTGRDSVLFAGMSPNLYAWVDNEPIDHRDLSGQFKVSGSVYAGFGGSISLTVTRSGFQVCNEVGVGRGGGIAIEPMAGLADSGLSAVAAVGVGPIGDGIQVPFDDCFYSGRPTWNLDGSAFDLANSAALLKSAAGTAGILDTVQRVATHIDESAKVEASLSLRNCLSPGMF